MPSGALAGPAGGLADALPAALAETLGAALADAVADVLAVALVALVAVGAGNAVGVVGALDAVERGASPGVAVAVHALGVARCSEHATEARPAAAAMPESRTIVRHMAASYHARRGRSSILPGRWARSASSGTGASAPPSRGSCARPASP
jgi:hypothetical protein